jgi:hypothetical protein
LPLLRAQLVTRTACQLPGKCVIVGGTARWDALHCPKLSSVLGRAIIFMSIASGSGPVQTAALENDARPAGLAAGTAPPLRGGPAGAVPRYHNSALQLRLGADKLGQRGGDATGIARRFPGQQARRNKKPRIHIDARSVTRASHQVRSIAGPLSSAKALAYVYLYNRIVDGGRTGEETCMSNNTRLSEPSSDVASVPDLTAAVVLLAGKTGACFQRPCPSSIHRDAKKNPSLH